MRIVALAGGVGASKLLLGMAQVMNPRHATVIVNTGDDITLHGLEISPDLDIVTYTLAGIINPLTGWGIRGDTFAALEHLTAYGAPGWFHLGDRDLATHIHRTEQLRRGASLSQVADSVRNSLGVASSILPMSDQPVRTMIRTRRGWLNFQEYLVKHRAKPVVHSIRFKGSKQASPAPGVLEAIRSADAIVICPSNPLISIGPILAVPGIRAALRARRDSVTAICPIVGGKSLKGPSDRMMRQMGFHPSAEGVAKIYRDFCSTLFIDRIDVSQSDGIEALGVRAVVTSTVMNSLADKTKLARALLAHLAAPASMPERLPHRYRKSAPRNGLPRK
jgi:LPPG:FO 2-phospho-L-lactate transferase